jgi:hypothetical protein
MNKSSSPNQPRGVAAFGVRLNTAGRMKQSDLDQAETALPEPQPQAMTTLESMWLPVHCVLLFWAAFIIC